MDIIISNTSGVPIYEQITQQIKNLIMRDILREGECLPSMRQLARELRISVITTKRAYEDLERDGFIVTMPGKGSFVAAKNTTLIREEQFRVCEECLQKGVHIAKYSGITLEELTDILIMMYKEE